MEIRIGIITNTSRKCGLYAAWKTLHIVFFMFVDFRSNKSK